MTEWLQYFMNMKKSDKMTKGTVVSEKKIFTLCFHYMTYRESKPYPLNPGFLKESNKSLPRAYSSEILLKIIQ